MAVLSDHGVHCCVAECNQRDFLPLTCDCCSKVFCLDHYRYEDHACPHASAKDSRVLICPVCEKGVRLVHDEDPNATMERHMHESCTGRPASVAGSRPGRKPRCPVAGCKQQLTFSNKVQCGKCCQTTCLKHRFEEDHNCAGVRCIPVAPLVDRAKIAAKLVLAF